jgi:Putative transposase
VELSLSLSIPVSTFLRTGSSLSRFNINGPQLRPNVPEPCDGRGRESTSILAEQGCHVVFTVPAPIAEIALHNKAVVYGILFTDAAETLRVIATDPRHIGAEIGLVAVLHTWGQNLHHHPHVHCVVPGGGPSADRTRWIGCRPGFFRPVKVLARLYRRLFLTRLQATFDTGQLRFFGDLASIFS